MELKEGQRLRVKEFDTRPGYWIYEGEMDEYMGKIVTFKEYNPCITIYEDNGKYGWCEPDFQIVFDTWKDIYNKMRNECVKYNSPCYIGCNGCKLKRYTACSYDCYTNLFKNKDYKQLAENFEKMFGMECYVLEDEKMRKEFRLSDLKDEMVVETRNNHRYLVFGKIFLGLNGFMGVESYSEDFKFIQGDKSFDIVAVYPKYGRYGYGFNGILNYVEEPIWKEEEEPVAKDVSLEEINALLKEKYPNVEKFNLPIDNDK